MTRALPRGTTSPSRTTLPSVLLVDDNPDDVLFFQLAWEKAGLANPVRFAASRNEAVDYLEGTGKFADRKNYPLPAVVVLDMKLTDGHTFDLVRWIRRHAKLNRLVVIILSGSDHNKDIAEAYRSGANSFLVKSVNPLELQKTVALIQSYWLCQNVTAAKAFETCSGA